MRILPHLLMTIQVMAQLASDAEAGPNAASKIAIHLASPTAKNPCGRAEAGPPCQDIVVTGNVSTLLQPIYYFAYVLVTNADAASGIGGAQFGVAYNPLPHAGVDILSWTTCATLQFPSTDWPASGSGNLITWDTTTRCQRNEPGGAGTGVVATLGYFYCAAYSPGSLQVTPRPADGFAKVSDCLAEEDIIASSSTDEALGIAMFSPNGLLNGSNPCTSDSLLSQDPSTWNLQVERVLNPTSHAAFTSPMWSPTGEKLAFRGPGGLYLADYPSTLPPMLIEPSVVRSFKWSPDGRYVAFKPYHPLASTTTDEIWVYDTVSSARRSVLTGSGRRYRNLSWTSGNNISVVDKLATDGSPGFTLTTVTPFGNLITPTESGAMSGAWVIAMPTSEFELWVGTPTSPTPARILADRSCYGVTGSPALDLLCVSTIVDGSACDAIVTSGGTLTTVLPVNCFGTSWSPAGGLLLGYEVTEIADGHETVVSGSELWIYRAATATVTPLTSSPDVDEREGVWHPGGRLLAFADGRSGSIVIASIQPR